MTESRGIVKDAVVIEALPDTIFRVIYNDKTEGLAYLSGRIRFNRIRVMVGDRVSIEEDKYGGKGRIIRRL